MSRVLVTGGAGVIGSHLVDRLIVDGHDVLVLDDLSSGDRANVGAVELRVGSVADRAAVEAAFAWRPDVVAHLAALFANQNSVEHPDDDLAVNGLGTLNVLMAASEVHVDRVLVCSSSCIYTGTGAAIESDESRSYATPYAITKALGEGYARFHAAHHGLSTVIVRPFNVYGPREHPGRYRNVIPNFIAAALRGEPLRITGTGEETRDFTYVSDIADGMLRALFADVRPGDAFNLASGVETTISDLASMINDLTGNDAGLEIGERRSWDRTTRRRASIDRARAALGYEPSVPLAEGLRATTDWFRAAT